MIKRFRPCCILILLTLLGAALVGCGRTDLSEVFPPTARPTSTPLPAANVPTPTPTTVIVLTGNAERGRAAFQAQHALPGGATWACQACHSVDSNAVRMIGPALWGIADRAGSRVEGEDAVTYLHQSILDPMAFIAPPNPSEPAWAVNMPEGWDQVLSEEELEDIIAYLFTLR
jgi:cytochrome c2